MDGQLQFDLALHRVPGLGLKPRQQLLQHFGSAAEVLRTSKSELRQCAVLSEKVLAGIRAPDWRGVERDLAWLAQPGHSLLKAGDAGYPAMLREIHDPPALLFVQGDTKLLGAVQVSMVGSRRPTAAGKKIAQDLASDLVAHGLVVTSGLASGIDTMAHRGALRAGGGTIAVLAHGPDRIYPQSNRDLAGSIRENGTIITEYPPGVAPLKHHFPVRNRIISGLGLGTVIVEAAIRSGSLITARLALEQGREVFAVPGSILNPLSEGCHWLLKQGARLTETVNDVLEELPRGMYVTDAPVSEINTGNQNGLAENRDWQILLDIMGYEPVSVEDLVHTSGLTAAEVSSMLLNMEIIGIVESRYDGTYLRIAR